MPATWPSIFQERLNQAEFSINYQDNLIRSSNETGPAKVRARTTKRTDPYRCQITIKISEWDEWDTFYTTSLNNGANTFYYNHPFTQVQKIWRMGTPDIKPIGGEYLNVTMDWELLP